MEKNNDKTLLAASLVALAGSAVMIASLFLPYITGGIGVADSQSMVSYVQLAMDAGETYTGSGLFGGIMLTLVVMIGVFSLLSLIFSAVRKPVPVIIFTIIAFIVFCILCWDFTDRGVVRDGGLSWGAAYYTFIVGAVISLGGAVFMLVRKIAAKKQLS